MKGVLTGVVFSLLVEKQIQQASIVEYVSRERSSEGSEVLLLFVFSVSCRLTTGALPSRNWGW